MTRMMIQVDSMNLEKEVIDAMLWNSVLDYGEDKLVNKEDCKHEQPRAV